MRTAGPLLQLAAAHSVLMGVSKRSPHTEQNRAASGDWTSSKPAERTEVGESSPLPRDSLWSGSHGRHTSMPAARPLGEGRTRIGIGSSDSDRRASASASSPGSVTGACAPCAGSRQNEWPRGGGGLSAGRAHLLYIEPHGVGALERHPSRLLVRTTESWKSCWASLTVSSWPPPAPLATGHSGTRRTRVSGAAERARNERRVIVSVCDPHPAARRFWLSPYNLYPVGRD